MCTLTLAWRAFDDAPVALAANRDEASDRPSEPPTVRGSDPAIVAPRDAEAGGTWIGLAATGLTVAITNRWLDADRDGDRSRGLLVWDCLRAGSAESAVRTVERELDERTYEGFTLVVADDVAAFLLSYDGGLAITRLDPGVHVVGNVGSVRNGEERFAVPERLAERGRDRVDSARRIATATAPRPGATATDWLDRASDVLADHAYGACLHGDGFGTRSFTRIRTGPDAAMAFADGPPCVTPAESVPIPDGFAGRTTSSTEPAGSGESTVGDGSEDGPESHL
ncbi:NRDE family protein [Halorubrum sp. DTA98]|uniref:NRDE family protein n=1 Tax=Halorubrum sp. DTA98 TaxID=3402163 RepID=UPI003AAFD3AB